MLIDALEARTPRPGPGAELVCSSAGFSFRVRPSATAAASASRPIPLTIIGSRPAYIPAPANPLPLTPPSRRYYVEWGTLNNLIAKNWDTAFVVSSTTYFFAKASLRTTGTLQVTSWEIVTGSTHDTVTTPDWDVGANRPHQVVVLLGTVFVDDDGVHAIAQSGGGSIVVGEHVTMIQPGSGAGEVQIGKELTCHRQAY